MRTPFVHAHVLVAAIACGVQAASCHAQTKTVFPAALATVEGESSTALPFGYSGPTRMQLVYHVAPPNGARSAFLKEFAFRADGRKNVAFPAKQYLECFVSISLTPNRYTGMSKEFAKNRYSPSLGVYSGKLALPAQPKLTSTQPRPFDLRFKLPKPWLHRNFDHGYLMIEIGIVNQPRGDWDVDSPFNCASVGQDVGKIGPQCRFSDTSLKDPRQPVLTNEPNVEVGGSATFTATNLPATAPTLFVFGIRETGPFAGGMLPRHMGDKVFPFPATDCYANTDWLGLRFAPAKNGRATASMPIPFDDVWRQVWFYCQTLTLDLAANPMGVVWSKARKVKPCGPVQCARVFSLGSYQVATGIVQTGAAPVLELTY